MDLVYSIAERFYNIPYHLLHSVDGMTLKSWIRLIAAVGAYLILIRPAMIKYGAKHQEKLLKKMEKEDEEKYKEVMEAKAKAKISANSLRGNVEEEEDSEGEGLASSPGDVQWGKKARTRQRKVVRRVLEEQERRGREDDEGNRSILDQFVDYEEGKDGW